MRGTHRSIVGDLAAAPDCMLFAELVGRHPPTRAAPSWLRARVTSTWAVSVTSWRLVATSL